MVGWPFLAAKEKKEPNRGRLAHENEKRLPEAEDELVHPSP